MAEYKAKPVRVGIFIDELAREVLTKDAESEGRTFGGYARTILEANAKEIGWPGEVYVAPSKFDGQVVEEDPAEIIR